VVPQLFPVLRSLASFHGFRGEVDKGIHYANEILALADTQHDASMRVEGLVLLGSGTGFSGRLEAGLGSLEEAIRAFEGGGYRARRLRLGIDPRVSCLTTAGFFEWLLGFPDRAVGRANRAVAIASELDHPYSLAYALYHSGFLHLWRREPEIVQQRATAALRIAGSTDLPVWRALGTCLLGAATSALGGPSDGLREIAAGVDLYQGLRTPPVFWPFIRYLHAGAYLEAGMAEPGLRMVDEAITLAGPDSLPGPLFHIARGDLLLVGPEPDLAEATASYELAYALGKRQDAPMPQLRAATRLVRIASDGAREGRVQALREVFATFTEGMTNPDLVEAATLLD
jgi:hypothetical protein